MKSILILAAVGLVLGQTKCSTEKEFNEHDYKLEEQSLLAKITADPNLDPEQALQLFGSLKDELEPGNTLIRRLDALIQISAAEERQCNSILRQARNHIWANVEVVHRFINHYMKPVVARCHAELRNKLSEAIASGSPASDFEKYSSDYSLLKDFNEAASALDLEIENQVLMLSDGRYNFHTISQCLDNLAELYVVSDKTSAHPADAQVVVYLINLNQKHCELLLELVCIVRVGKELEPLHRYLSEAEPAKDLQTELVEYIVNKISGSKGMFTSARKYRAKLEKNLVSTVVSPCEFILENVEQKIEELIDATGVLPSGVLSHRYIELCKRVTPVISGVQAALSK